jgi:predicted pyridoxine 5'-phosphate oxidase superfamily flavin-nucleotide-binding protein
MQQRTSIDERGPIFHEGERALQEQAGMAERLARVGPQMIRDHLPEQHRHFFGLLPFILIGSVDERGQPSASLLAAPPGFVSSPDPSTLRIGALPHEDDPLHANLRPGASLGVLGIQPHTRRRNRANGTVRERDGASFSLHVQQSFGNCPKYIHPREASYAGATPREPVIVSTGLGDRERALIRRADTFFLASAHPRAFEAGPAQGVDVSHRGGPRGFAHFTDDETFIVPDYAGNNLYNTLGNLLLNRAAGLLFIDTDSRDILQLEASADILTGSHPFAGPEPSGRVVRFSVQRARLFPSASPLRFSWGTTDALR